MEVVFLWLGGGGGMGWGGMDGILPCCSLFSNIEPSYVTEFHTV